MHTTHKVTKRKRLTRLVAIIGGFFLGIVLTGVALLSLPSVQNALIRYVIKKINEKTAYTIHCQAIDLTWRQGITLTEVVVKDTVGNQPLCYAKHIKLQFDPLDLLWHSRMTIDVFHIVDGQLNLLREKEHTDFNLQLFWDRLSKPSAYSTPAIWLPIAIKTGTLHTLVLENCTVEVDDQHKVALPTDIFDPFHCTISQVNAVVKDVVYNKNRLTGTLQSLSTGYASYDLPIHRLSMQFKVSPTAAYLQNVVCAILDSHVRGDVELTYQDVAGWGEVYEKVNVLADLQDVSLSATDMAYFIPYFKGIKTRYQLKGKVVGTLHDLYVKDFYVVFGEKESYLAGTGAVKGLPYLDKAYCYLDIHDGHLATEDLLPHVDQAYHAALKKIKFVNLKTQVTAGTGKLLTNTLAITDRGTLSANLTANLDADVARSTYQGTIRSEQLQLGELLAIPSVGPISLTATINGQGLTLPTAQAEVEMYISDAFLYDKLYTGIQAKGKLAYNFFQGDIALNDSSCKGSFTTKIDLQGSQKKLSLQGEVESIELHTVGITNPAITLGTHLDVYLTGTGWDDWAGEALLKQVSLTTPDKQATIQNITIKNLPQLNGNLLTIESDLFSLTAMGQIQYSTFLQDIQHLFQPYQQRVVGHNVQPRKQQSKPYQFTYQITLQDINPILQLGMPSLYLAPQTAIQGYFKQSDDTQLAIHIPDMRSWQIAENHFQGGSCSITASQDAAGNIAATTNLSINQHQFKPYLETNHLQLTVDWRNDTINFATNVGEEHNQWHFNLAGTTTLGTGSLHTTFYETIFQLPNQRWQLSPDNALILSIPEQSITCNNLSICHDNQCIQLAGKWSPHHTEQLVLSFQSVALQTLPYFLNKKINGMVDGNLAFSNLAGQVALSSDFKINQIIIDALPIGDFWVKTFWQSHARNIQILGQLQYESQPIIDLTGVYEVTRKDQPIELVASFSNAQLALLTPFVSDVFRQFSGQLDGTFYIKGPLSKLQLTGDGQLKALQLQFNYLHASYQGYANLHCLGNTIQLTELQLEDSQQGTAHFVGQIGHNYLHDFTLDITGKLHNLEVLHTQYEDNPIFYGKGIVDGQLNLTGPVENITIRAQAVTQKGTKIAIETLRYIEKAEQENYIHFVDSRKEKTKAASLPTAVTLQGFTLYLNLEITPEAWAELVINKKDGDNLQAKGKGFLTIQSDAEGSINMSGTYQLMEGTYIFSAYGIIKKKLKILPNSTITWIDQPYDAMVSIKAAHNQFVNLASLITPKQTDPLQVEKDGIKETKKYPISILLSLEGKLSAPQLKFDIQFQELPADPTIREAVSNFQEKIANDKNYLTNQIFSLFLLKRFSPQESMVVGGKTLSANVNEIVSQQISSLLQQMDENLAIDIDLDEENMAQEMNPGLPVKVSYNLLGERLVIARKGNLNFVTNRDIALADVAGDWSLEYSLTQDNHLKLKLQVSPSSANDPLLTQSAWGAFSFVHTTSFNRWRDLMKRKPPADKTAQ